MTAAPLVCLHFGNERHNTPRYSDKNPPFQKEWRIFCVFSSDIRHD